MEADAVDDLRWTLEHPDDSGLRAFVFRGALCYLAVGYEFDPPQALEAIFAVEEGHILDAAGFEVVATARDEDFDWTKPDKIVDANWERRQA